MNKLKVCSRPSHRRASACSITIRFFMVGPLLMEDVPLLDSAAACRMKRSFDDWNHFRSIAIREAIMELQSTLRFGAAGKLGVTKYAISASLANLAERNRPASKNPALPRQRVRSSPPFRSYCRVGSRAPMQLVVQERGPLHQRDFFFFDKLRKHSCGREFRPTNLEKFQFGAHSEYIEGRKLLRRYRNFFSSTRTR